ncbi:unnamed protein product [Durusdinium trenchii]|uniref:Uncharacterized protein n=1 Tax=Durusdinium trenchii TaxID=1381693 RepID=A0ABP0J0U9_9DINO
MVSRNASHGLVLKIAIPGARASESSLFKSLNIDSLFICLKKEWVWFEELPEIGPSMLLRAAYCVVLAFSVIENVADGRCFMYAPVETDAESSIKHSQFMKGLAVPNPPKPYETDPKAMEMLWRTSEEATGVKFTI